MGRDSLADEWDDDPISVVLMSTLALLYGAMVGLGGLALFQYLGL